MFTLFSLTCSYRQKKYLSYFKTLKDANSWWIYLFVFTLFRLDFLQDNGIEYSSLKSKLGLEQASGGVL